MGFLIFAFMKQNIRRQIDRKQFQLTLISNKLTQMQDQIADMQQHKNSILATADDLATAGSSLAAACYKDAYDKNQKEAESILQTKPDYDKKALQADIAEKNKAAADDYQAQLAVIATAKKATNSIFELTDNIQLSALNRQESQMSSEKESLESQLKLLNGQYDSYEKGETEEAKKATPNFGLA